MKIMQVSLSIDVQDKKQSDALKQLMDTLSGEEQPTKKATPAPEPEEEEEEETPAPRKRPARSKKKAAPAPEPEEEEEDDLVGEEEDETEDVKIDLPTLREMTAARATKFRAEIKEKLAELGASNVSSIKEDDFQEYYDFLESL